VCNHAPFGVSERMRALANAAVAEITSCVVLRGQYVCLVRA
jgi:hypothetical protein